ncbi:MAG: hypothetical protein OHK0011_11040 [Turneriella sp.]
MAKKLLWLPILLVLHCAGSDAMYDPPGGKGFWARKSDLTTGKTTFYRVASMFAAASAHANLYVEVKGEVPKSSIDGLLSAFENNIVPVEHVWFTTPTDVDQNGKVILLLLDIQDGYREGSSSGYIAGYFDPLNHYSDASVNALNSEYHSNQAEMLYLDTYPADVTRTAFFATLAHEYQHLLQFGKYYKGEQNDIEPTWIDEGLSEVSSDLTGFGPQVSRANTFRSALINNTSLIREPAQFGLEHYANTYIYFRYLADVYGLGLISSIFNNNVVGLAGINDSISSADAGLTGICGNTVSHSYRHFDCSYRFMWAALIAGNIGDSPTGTIIRHNGSADSTLGASGNFTYRLNAGNLQFSQELASSLLNGSYDAAGSRPTGALQSYAPLLAKIKSGGSPPTFLGCSDCGLTIVQGSSYYAVFNHDANTSTTHSATIVDSLQPSGSLEPTAALPEPVAETPLEHRAMHWHFRLPKTQLELLSP